MSKIKTAEEIKALIKGRIEDEYRRHPNLDWAEIAASRLYSQWNEFFTIGVNKELFDRIAELEFQTKVTNLCSCMTPQTALNNFDKICSICNKPIY